MDRINVVNNDNAKLFFGVSMKNWNMILTCLLFGSTTLPLITGPVATQRQDGNRKCNCTNEYGAVWRPFLMADLERVSEDVKQLHDIYEVDQNFQNGLVLANTGQEILQIVRTGVDGSRVVKVADIPKFPGNPLHSSVKFRNGNFYARKDGQVLKYDKGQNKWSQIFHTRKRFSQFEISPDNKIILICSSLPKEKVLLEGDETPELYSCSDDYRTESIQLMEIYGNNKSTDFDKAIEFPDSIKEVFRLTNHVPMIDKVFWVEDVLFLLNSQLGNLFAYDLKKSEIATLKVPWPMLDWHFLSGNHLMLPKEKGRGVVKISRFSFPDRLLCYPQGRGRLLVQVRMPSGFEPGFSAERDRAEWLHGNRFVPLAKEYTKDEKERKLWVKHYLFDWTQNRFEELSMPRVMGSKVDCSRHYLLDSDVAIPLTVPASGR